LIRSPKPVFVELLVRVPMKVAFLYYFFAIFEMVGGGVLKFGEGLILDF
jgi:hypothetical protein